MTMATVARLHCPTCGRPTERTALRCPNCGEDFAWASEQRGLALEYLRYAGVVLVGGALLSMAFLVPLGFLTMLPALVLPLWVALVALGAAVWLMAGRIAEAETPVGDGRRSEVPIAAHKKKNTRRH